jgi:hypothetical protein
MLMMLIYWVEAYVRSIKENVEVSIVASNETGVEVNADKTKYMVVSRH